MAIMEESVFESESSVEPSMGTLAGEKWSAFPSLAPDAVGAALPDVLVSVSAQVLAPLRDAITVARKLAEEAEREGAGDEGRLASPGWGRDHAAVGTYAASLRSVPHGTSSEIQRVRELLLLEDASRHFRLGRLPGAFAQLAGRTKRSATERAHEHVRLAAASRQFLRAAASARYGAFAVWRSFAIVRQRRLIILPHMRRRLSHGLDRISRAAHARETATRAARRWRAIAPARALSAWMAAARARARALHLLEISARTFRHRVLARAFRSAPGGAARVGAKDARADAAVAHCRRLLRSGAWGRLRAHARERGRLGGGQARARRAQKLRLPLREWRRRGAAWRALSDQLGAGSATTRRRLLRRGLERLRSGAGREETGGRLLTLGASFFGLRTLALCQHAWRGAAARYRKQRSRVLRLAARRQRAWDAWRAEVAKSRACVRHGVRWEALSLLTVAMHAWGHR